MSNLKQTPPLSDAELSDLGIEDITDEVLGAHKVSIAGYIFLKGVLPEDREAFIEEHEDVLRTLWWPAIDRANSTLIGEVYAEYRPNVGSFDTVLTVARQEDE